MPFLGKKTDKSTSRNSNAASSGKPSIQRTSSSTSNASSVTACSLDIEPDIGAKNLYKGPCLLIPADDLEERGYSGIVKTSLSMPMSSRLSKTLSEIVHDRDASDLFIAFMESRKADHLIRFWLDAESFHVATLTRKRTQFLKSVSKSSLVDQQKRTSPKSNFKNICDKQISAIHKDGENIVDDVSRKNTQMKTNFVNDLRPDENNTLSVSKHYDMAGRLGSDERWTEDSNHISHDQSTRDPVASTSTQNCDNLGLKSRHLSEPIFTEKLQDLAGSSPKHRHFSDSHTPSEPVISCNNVKTKSGYSKEDINEKLKKSIARDAVNIFTRYLSQDATHPIGVTDDYRNETIRNICQEDGEVDPECFLNCQQFTFDLIQKDHFPAFQGSEYHCKHQVDILTSGLVYLPDILYNEMALFYLTEFLEQEEVSHLLQFWMAVDNFQQHLASQQGQYDGIEAQNDAMIFYDKYFSLQASQPLGFDDVTRFEIESNICREGGPLPDVFSKPRDIVLHTLDKIYFEQFLKSEIYYKYLSDLVSTVNLAQDLPAKRKRTGSDASSEHSGGSRSIGADRNTLLAIDSSSIKKALNKLDVDMRIDNYLLNPEELWKRPAENKMSLGAMNNFGQFVSEFAPEPDHKEKKKSFFKKSRTKEKEQEEMALQIAQMIINDVATMTKTGDVWSGKDDFTGSAIKEKCTKK